MRRSFLAFLLLVLGAPAALHAEGHPNVARGFAPDKVFALGDIDNVNLFNGNLALTIPIGGAYPVGGGFSYGLRLVYNSNVWDFQESVDQAGNPHQQGLPQRTNNAGLGWQLTLGRLMAPSTPGNDTERWVYLGTDGAEHAFYPKLHVGDPDEPGDNEMFQSVSYTRDGSYLRMTLLVGNSREIESPNGQIHLFDGLQQLTQIRDRFGNALNVAYTNLLWTLTDTQGRTQRIYFQNVTQDGHTIEVVNRAELKAFGGTTATYSFGYASTTIGRGCPSNDPAILTTVVVPLLTSVSLPDGSSYQMPTSDYITNLNPESPVCRSSGDLKGLTLPTLGRLEWTYQDYIYPTGAGKVHLGFSAGIATRQTRGASGDLLGTWTYTPTLVGTLNSPTDLIRTVTDPLGSRTEHHFRPQPRNYDYSLPFTLTVTDAGFFLSARTYNSSNVLQRSSFARYDADQQPTTYADLQELYAVDRRELASHTVFDDDAGHFADVTRSDFDGMGHYRTSTTDGNFNVGNVRTTTVDYNAARGTYLIDPVTGLPAPGFNPWPSSQVWVLETFDSTLTTEGGASAFTRYCFDATTGFLRRQRTLKNSGTTENAHDLLAVFTPSASGNVQSEQSFGGDTQSLTANNTTCLMSVPSAVYQVDHAYQGGVRASSAYSGAGFNFLDQTIDVSSRLPSQSKDTAGLATDYEYDALGRVLWAKPSQEGYSEYVYTRATSAASLANVLVRHHDNVETPPIRAQAQVFFDAFGRV